MAKDFISFNVIHYIDIIINYWAMHKDININLIKLEN